MDSKYQLTKKQWEELSKKLYYCKNINPENSFFEEYFKEMNRLIIEIKQNPYPYSLEEEDKQKLKSDLYNLDGMFITYYSNMLKFCIYMNETFHLYDTENEFDFLLHKINYPHSHNFNKYLSWGDYFSPELFKEYYMLIVDAIEEFLKNKGEFHPKYLYNLIEGTTGFLVEKYEYLTWDMIPHEKGTNLSLLEYHKISGPHGTKENYEKFYRHYYKNEKEFERVFYNFLERVWPIRVWISENRPLIPDKIIKFSDIENSKIKNINIEREE